tara:strand:+ start:175 stop:579 length:405 start_codon:yes stop_codon:yes gene_type:complete
MEIENDSVNSDIGLIGSGGKVFQVFKDSYNTVELVHTGISWAAFFFSGLWLVYKGMYIVAGQIFLFCTLILLIGIPETIIPFVSSGIGIYLGLRGNLLYANYLKKNGYKPFLIINADNVNHAKLQFADYMKEQN